MGTQPVRHAFRNLIGQVRRSGRLRELTWRLVSTDLSAWTFGSGAPVFRGEELVSIQPTNDIENFSAVEMGQARAATRAPEGKIDISEALWKSDAEFDASDAERLIGHIDRIENPLIVPAASSVSGPQTTCISCHIAQQSRDRLAELGFDLGGNSGNRYSRTIDDVWQGFRGRSRVSFGQATYDVLFESEA